MTFDIKTDKGNKVRISLGYSDVEKIEAERILCPAELVDEADPPETHYRTIRVTTMDGGVLELELQAAWDDNLMVEEVGTRPKAAHHHKQG